MRRPIVLIVLLVIAVIIMAVAFVRLFPTLAPVTPVTPQPQPAPTHQPDAAAVEANNRGVGLMGRYEYAAAVDVFSDLVNQYPHWLEARINLAIATLNRQRDGDEQQAVDILADVLADEPEHLHARYITGLLRLYLGDLDEAHDQLQFVADRDPRDAHAAYFLAQTHAQRGEHEQALQWYERALQLDPYLRSAYWGQFQMLQRMGEDELAMQMLDAFERLAGNPRAHTADFIYARMGPKAKTIPAGIDIDPAPLPDGPVFAEAAPLLVNGDEFTWTIRRDDRPVSITAADITGNGHLDVFIANVLDQDGVVNAVCINNGNNRFAVDADHPLAGIDNVNAALWGDFDNDGLTDVYLCRTGPNMLWRQVAPGQWEDVTEATGTANGSFDSVNGLFFDADHDGDLDIFVVNFDGPNELLNNNRDGTFTPIAQQQGIAGDGLPSRQVIALDLEGDRDLDLIVINEKPPHEMYLNDRLWAYRPAEQLRAFRQTEHLAVATADTGSDGRMELFTVTAGRVEMSAEIEVDGQPALPVDAKVRMPRVDRWVRQADGTWSRESDAHAFGLWSIDATRMPLFVIDVDGAGTPEPILVAVDDLQGLHIVRRQGDEPPAQHEMDGIADAEQLVAAMREQAPRAIKRPPAGAAVVVLDAARGPSIVAAMTDGPPMILRAGPGRHAFTAVSFTGKEDAGQFMRSNASGIGTYYAARIGSRWVAGNTLPNHSGPGQSLQPVGLGLGGASKIDFLHIDWPDGVFQSELDLAAAEHHIIAEEQRELSSCPVLWAWDGEKYEFISDILGVGGMGFLTGAPGEYAPSRPWERFMFPIGLLQPKDGRYHIKLGEPMEEACYLDAARLVIYDLPPGWSMTIDERMHIGGPAPTGDTRFYRRSMLPALAVNDRGEDVTATITEANLQAAPVGEHDLRFIGRLKRDNVITLTFPHAIDSGDGEPMLIADGWIEYPYSQTAFAAWQAGADYRAPTIEARGDDGQWHVLLEQFGYPAGMPRQMSVPLENLPPGTTQLRIATNQEIYWDRFMIAWAEAAPDGMQRAQLDLVAATLSRSGFALRADRPQRLPYYDYARRVPLWDTRHQAGWYTRFGPVDEIIRDTNHALAIFGPGEEIHMEFRAPGSDVPEGWTRYHVFEADGWCKDMDLFTRDGDTLEPLPGEVNEIREKLHRRFNTRWQSGR